MKTLPALLPALIFLPLISTGCGGGGGEESDADADSEADAVPDQPEEDTADVPMDDVPMDEEVEDGVEQEARCGNGLVEAGEECDDGNDVDGDGCEGDCTFSCTEATQEADCEDSMPCTDDLCDAATHACSNPFSANTTVCRPSAGDCDVPEHCTGSSASCPEDVRDVLSDVSSIAAGGTHTCAVMSSGAAKCWGSNLRGQLGDGTTANSHTPLDVAGLSSGVSAIAGGNLYTCAALAAGGVKCWGENTYGQLGDGTTTDSLTPVDVSGLTSVVSAIAAKWIHTCVLLDTGGVKCWGHNNAGQLGDGTQTDSSTPVDVSGLSSGVSAVTVGGTHTCALLDTGGVKCWGDNWKGQLGDGTTTFSTTPVDVSGLSSGVSAIAAGETSTCALLDTGGVKCWGDNRYSQLGDGTHTDSSIPVDVLGLSSGVSAIAVGGDHACAILDTGGVKCWGINSQGQLGDGTIINSPIPLDVSNLPFGVSDITAGGHTCAILDGGVMCWGGNEYGQLGDGTMTYRTTPVDVSGISSGVTAITTGGGHTGALLSTGGVVCWGGNGHGQLGDGLWTNGAAPVDVSSLSSDATAITAGLEHTCALLDTGGVMCWGCNSSGQLGNGATMDRAIPVDASGLSSGVAAVDAGASHTCALLATGGVRCWGSNMFGQLGDGTTTDHPTPLDVAGLASGASSVAAGGRHTCALLDTGGIKCWGSNGRGQLGDGTTTQSLTPVDVAGLSSGASAIAAGTYHTCALLDTGGVKCWGFNNVGQLGDGTSTNRTAPVDVSGLTSGVSAITAGENHTCALLDTGGVMCWGNNDFGQLGDGTMTYKTTPVDVSGLSSGVSAVDAGGDTFPEPSHTCALLDTGGVMCWGGDRYGQVSGFFSGYPHFVVCM